MNHGQRFVVLAAALVGTPLMAQDASSAERPVRLMTEETASGVRLMVIGDAEVEAEVRYRLEVEGRDGRNRVSQGGRAHLVPGRTYNLTTVNLGERNYEARLKVDVAGGGSYEEVAPAASEG